jgi:hypothetical protein
LYTLIRDHNGKNTTYCVFAVFLLTDCKKYANERKNGQGDPDHNILYDEELDQAAITTTYCVRRLHYGRDQITISGQGKVGARYAHEDGGL